MGNLVRGVRDWLSGVPAQPSEEAHSPPLPKLPVPAEMDWDAATDIIGSVEKALFAIQMEARGVSGQNVQCVRGPVRSADDSATVVHLLTPLALVGLRLNDTGSASLVIEVPVAAPQTAGTEKEPDIHPQAEDGGIEEAQEEAPASGPA